MKNAKGKGKGKRKMEGASKNAGPVEKATTPKGVPPGEEEGEAYFKYVRENRMRLDPNGEKTSRLSCVVNLLAMQKQQTLSNESISAMLALIKELFPNDKEFPGSYDDAVKLIQKSGGANYFADLL